MNLIAALKSFQASIAFAFSICCWKFAMCFIKKEAKPSCDFSLFTIR
jgi:hypothetical protein